MIPPKPRIYMVCPDFLRPMSDQLEAGQYVLYSDYLKLCARAEWAIEALKQAKTELDSPHPLYALFTIKKALSELTTKHE